ncbi:hypothetical protein C2869_08060 [Saccharobesus litoralis]|uniref:histidine kinase n=1 Tax=Saccharobesus litoralis TaxID=2172099 RepID=A0A2S0VQ98_9ALTE|nr:ATP-binding protein [Saccharobesus litoralis]AWB66384.1 hypothetical protein C2869_08060 [Saccharobesus litoralis]
MRRLTLSLIAVTLTAAIGLGWLLDWYYQSQSQANEDYAPLIEPKQWQVLALQSARVLAQQPELASEFTAQGLSVSFARLDDFPLPTPLFEQFVSGEPLVLNSQSGVSLHSFQAASQTVVSFQFANTTEPTEPETADPLLLTLLFYLGIIVFIALWLTPLIRRLLLVNRAMVQFGEGQLDRRIPLSKFSYLHNIELGFNQMAQRITSLIADNKLLSRAVSHDLRTPIARLRFGIDMLQETNTDTSKNQYFEQLDRDLDAMESLVESLLHYAKLEKAKVSLSLQAVELNALLGELLKPLQTQNHIILDWPQDQAFTAQLDKHYMSMLLNNLINNAVRYAKTQIKISLTKQKSALILTIEDDGKGMDKDEFDKVLLPFYRIADHEDVPSQKMTPPVTKLAKGHGMGLAIVSRIAEWHKIDLQLSRSHQLGGLAVRLVIPIE